MPSVAQDFKKAKNSEILLKKTKRILCAKFRKGHFEGVLNILNHFIKLISPQIVFMGQKDYQQLFLVKNFIEKNYESKVYSCKTIRNSNKVALSSRNSLLSETNLKTAGLIAKKLFNIKKKINKNKNQSKSLIKNIKKELIKKFDIKIEYLECRNSLTLSTNLYNKPFRLFISYYLNNVRLIDNF